MANLSKALEAALRARYQVSEVKTPVSQRRGLLARMNHLEKLHHRRGDTSTQTRRRAAEAAGIPDRTWRDWRKGTHPPSAASQRKLEGAYTRQITLPALRRELKVRPVPKSVRITATIKWSYDARKQYNSTAHRTTTLTNMRPVMASVIRAWAGAGAAAAAEVFERRTSQTYGVRDDGEKPGIEFEGDQVEIEFS